MYFLRKVKAGHHLLILMVSLNACSKSLSVNGQNVGKIKASISAGTPATATPTLIPGGLQANRSYYQTRSTIALSLSNNLVQSGDTFSLIDTQSGSKIVDNQPVGENLALTGQSSTTLALLDSYDLVLYIYPSDPQNSGKLIYGGNDLNVQVSGNDDHQATQHVDLHDFVYMSQQMTYFSDNVQSVGGFQGETSAYQSPVMSNGSNLLSTGFIATLSH